MCDLENVMSVREVDLLKLFVDYACNLSNFIL